MEEQERGSDDQMRDQGVTDEQVEAPVETDDQQRAEEEKAVEEQPTEPDPGEQHEERPPVTSDDEAREGEEEALEDRVGVTHDHAPDSPPISAPSTDPPGPSE
jgi:hypothetical protein